MTRSRVVGLVVNRKDGEEKDIDFSNIIVRLSQVEDILSHSQLWISAVITIVSEREY